MNLGAVLPSVALKCPKCNSVQLRRSRWHRDDGRRSLALIYSPYRCVSCGKRFFKLSHRFETMLGWGAVALLVLSAIAGIVYVMNMDTIKVAAVKRPFTSASAPIPAAGNSAGSAAAAPYARAVAGDTRAQLEMGMMHLNGEGGVAKSYAEALKWLELAAKGGEAEARYNLGIMYKSGLGALQNFEMAFQWFELAAGQNHVEAQYNVALMYKNGISVPVDLVKSYMWVNLAAAQGHVGAIALRDNLLGAMTPQQVAEGQRASREWKPVTVDKPKDTVPPAAAPAKG